MGTRLSVIGGVERGWAVSGQAAWAGSSARGGGGGHLTAIGGAQGIEGLSTEGLSGTQWTVGATFGGSPEPGVQLSLAGHVDPGHVDFPLL